MHGKRELNNKKLYVTALSLYNVFLCNFKSTQFRTHSLDFRDLQANEKHAGKLIKNIIFISLNLS